MSKYSWWVSDYLKFVVCSFSNVGLWLQFYKKVFFDFIDDDHEHAVSITALTVQVCSFILI